MISDSKPRLLIIDDEENMRHMLSSMLKSDYETELAESGAHGLSILSESDNLFFDFILCDIRMPEMDGLAFLECARKLISDTPVIMMSAYGTVELAIEAMKKGAYDYISKPFRKDELILVLKKAMERESLKKENFSLKRQLEKYKNDESFPGMIGRSEPMKRVFFLARKAADSDVTVLITGESGTGKELIAKGIHALSKRSGRPLVSVNCAALPENLIESELFGHVKGSFTGATIDKKGLFSEADGGSIFLDEIGELPLNLQVKLLRVLQEGEIRPLGAVKDRKIDVRVITATSRNLQEDVSKGIFREDLFYRLNVLNINIPPLRARAEDIQQLCLHFIGKASSKIPSSKCKGITREALDFLFGYSWPGNVRELENHIERAVLLAEETRLDINDFPDVNKFIVNNVSFPDYTEIIEESSLSIKEAQRRTEAFLIRKALAISKGNRTHAAKMLEISHPSLLVKIKLYNIC